MIKLSTLVIVPMIPKINSSESHQVSTSPIWYARSKTLGGFDTSLSAETFNINYVFGARAQQALIERR